MPEPTYAKGQPAPLVKKDSPFSAFRIGIVVVIAAVLFIVVIMLPDPAVREDGYVGPLAEVAQTAKREVRKRDGWENSQVTIIYDVADGYLAAVEEIDSGKVRYVTVSGGKAIKYEYSTQDIQGEAIAATSE